MHAKWLIAGQRIVTCFSYLAKQGAMASQLSETAQLQASVRSMWPKPIESLILFTS